MSQHAEKYVQPSEFMGPSGLAAARPLTRRHMAALLALAPVALLLSACATEKPHDGREQRPTYKNGQRGSGGPGRGG
jgi:hypothetical protein